MKKTLFALTALLLAVPLWAQADHPRRGVRRIVADDDDGKVEIYRRGDAVVSTGGASPIQRPVFEVIFAGAGWDDASKNGATAHVGRIPMPDGVQPAAVAGTHTLTSPDRMNDLQVQSLIDRAMRDGALPSRDDNTIYVVFLGRSVQSTLGASKAARDYDSYHSHFHVHDTNVRYVVVPWNDDESARRDAAAISAVRAVVNPDGN